MTIVGLTRAINPYSLTLKILAPIIDIEIFESIIDVTAIE